MAGCITQFHDLHRKVIPAANPFIGEMVDTRNECTFLGPYQHSQDSRRQIPRIRRRTDLVEHDRQLFPFISQPQHRLDKISTELGVKPCRTDDDRIGANFLQSLFTGKFRTPVDRSRTSLVRFHIGKIVRTVEHIIGRDMDHSRSCRTRRFS